MSRVTRSHLSQSRRYTAIGTAAVLVTALASMLGGCPIYAADSCEQDPNCRARRADTGPTPVPTTDPPPTDCGSGCAPGYVCTSVSTGRYACAAYDCRATEKACTEGKKCLENESGVYVCALETPTDCAKTGCISGYTCAPGEIGKRICVSTDANACVADGDCTSKTGAGSLCLGGVCKAPKDLCSDSTQCKTTATCVDGRCTPKCASTCATGYTCDDKSGLCTAGKGACGAGGTACATGSTCVESRCVETCATDGSCKTAGTVCVAGGCVVDDRPNFFCDKDGSADGKQDLCAGGSVCLHHNCYLSCTGPTDTTSCAKADKFPTCKSVTTSSGAHNVCGSTTSLGSECDPTTTPPKACNVGKVCIDGFCK